MTVPHGNARVAPARGFWKVFGFPIAIAIMTGVGLVAGLVGDGWLDVLAWIGLAVPVAVCAWAILADRAS